MDPSLRRSIYAAPRQRSSLGAVARGEMAKRQYVVKGTTFEVDERYEVKKGVGQGAYGLICAAKDTKTGDQVAIKKITNAFEDAVDCKRILREIRLLQHFSHENVLNLRDIMMPPPGKAEDWKDIYLVTELLDTDLHYIIHSKQALSDDHIQYFVYQILRGLKAVHSAKVLHRDLKPGNLLVNKNCDLKICDFGLARGVDSGSQALTEYVVTRWYRAPELLVENETYGPEIDIWSVGCILAEFLGRKAIFPGRDYLQQLRLIVECLGAPSASDLSMINNPQAVEYIKALPKRPAVSFAKLYPNANAAAVSLLEKMLVFDPRKRITAADALKHEYLTALHNVNDEPDAAPFDFAFEKEGEETALRAEILGQLKQYHPGKVDEEMEKRFAAAPTAS
jgi:serine/threonine protein kinase